MANETTDTETRAALGGSRLQAVVGLRCPEKGCPRTATAPFDSDTMPPGTATIESLCPWHDHGDFQEEMYFDAEGFQLNVDGERLTQQQPNDGGNARHD